jgi:uncharacterized membrane protein YhfC
VTQVVIPDLTIIFSAISLAICVILPVGGIIFCRLKYKMPLYPILFGAVTFYLFVLILEAAAHDFLLGTFTVIAKTPLLYAFYGAIMAGIFEETGRLISFTIIERVAKKPQTARTGISYGLGHGGFEAVFLIGLTFVNNIVISIMNNNGSLSLMLLDLPSATQSAYLNAAFALSETPSWQFLLGGLERIIAIALQLALSVVMFYAVFGKRKIWLFPVAILLHMAADMPAALLQAGIIPSDNIVLVECITAFIAAAIVVFAAWVHDKYKDTLAANIPIAAGVGESTEASEPVDTGETAEQLETNKSAGADDTDESE